MFGDLKFALRSLRMSPGFALVAVVVLALGIGSNTAIFSAVYALLLHPLPYADPERLITVKQNLPHYGLKKFAPSPPEFVDYRKMAACFSQISGDVAISAVLTGGEGPPEEVEALRVSSSVFPMLGVTPILGGLFTAENERYGNDRVVMISESLWTRRYGADRSIIGKSIQVNRESYRLAGVMRPILEYRGKYEMWMPLAFPPAEIAAGSSGPHNLEVIGRLKPGVTLDQARDEFRRLATRLAEMYPDQDSKKLGFTIDLDPLADQPAGSLKKPLLFLIAAVGAVMLIACANVSSLLLARATLRRKEISIRASLGASRMRVIRQLLTESLLLAGMAGLAGLVAAFYGLHLFTQFGPHELIRGVQPGMNSWVVLFSITLSIAASVLFGVAPAMETSRIDLSEALKNASRGSTGRGQTVRESMVVLEVAVSLMLLMGASLLVRSFIRLQNTSSGLRTENVLTAVIPLSLTDYPQPSQRIALERTLLDRVRALPMVRSAGALDFPPFLNGIGSHIEVVGRPRLNHEPTPIVYQARTSPGYFEAAGISLLKGRAIGPSDGDGAPPVCNIDETVAKSMFANSDPIGMQVMLPIPSVTCTIIGVVGATKMQTLAGDPVPRVYYSSGIHGSKNFPLSQLTLVVKAARDPLGLVPVLRREVAALDSNLPLSKPLTLDQILSDSLARPRFAIQLMGLFAGVAALLAAIGIYGVLAYVVDQRRREVGIRMALGARAGDVFGLVLRRGSKPVALGVAFGLAGGLALTRVLGSLLYEVSATDPVIIAAVLLGLIIVAFLAIAIPARRATLVNPVDALRHE